jgi:GNAT superfamily N-acetyltransferase
MMGFVSTEFRPAEIADLDRIVPMMSRLYGQDGLPFDAARVRGTAEWLLAHPDSGGIWTIEADGAAAGYIVMTVCASLEFHGRFALLDELYLEEPWRGRGLGARAIEFAAQWAQARGMAAVRLETAHDNLRAQRLYRKRGFVLHDRHLMTKWL